ncbi:hypothetical protein Tco_0591273 [Tanacetum coccineum]
MTNKIDTVLKAITDKITGTLPSDTIKNPKLGTHPVSSARSYPITDLQCSTQIHSSINTITIQPKQPGKSRVDKPKIEHEDGNPDDTNSNPQPQLDPFASIATEQVRIREFDARIAGLVPHPLIQYSKLNPREDANGGISNFTGRIKGMHVFIGNFTYLADFMIVEDISSIIDPRLSNEEDKRRGVEYVMSKILGFYKECLELGPEYLTGVDDEGEVTYFAFGGHFDELHVTWAHLEKKRSRSQANIKTLEDLCSQSLEAASPTIHDAVTTHLVTSIFSSCYLFCNPFLSTTMGDENHIRTLGDYSRPSHEGYKNTIELPEGNNVSEDPNQHLKDFLKLVDSLDLDDENRERRRLRLFQAGQSYFYTARRLENT